MSKLGKAVAAETVVNGTVAVIGPLPAGEYSIEFVGAAGERAFAIQCGSVVGLTPPSAALLRAQGVSLWDSCELEFSVDVPATDAGDVGAASTGDGYIVIVKASGAADGGARVCDRSRSAGTVA